MADKSTFTIMGSGIGYSGGNYKNYDPVDAAKKAGKALFKKLEDSKFRKYKNKTLIRFILRKRDRRSAGKTYSYEVTRTKLKKPIIMKRGDSEYLIKYNYDVKSCPMDASEVKRLTGGCLTCAIGGNRKLKKGGNDEGDVDEADQLADDMNELELDGDGEDEGTHVEGGAEGTHDEEDQLAEGTHDEVPEDGNTPEEFRGGKKKKTSKKAPVKKKASTKKK